MITDHIEGVVSLIKTNNVVMMNEFIETGFITTDQICTALSKIDSLYSTDMNFLAILIDKLDFIDGVVLDMCVRSFSDSNHVKYDWNENTAHAFAKLIEWGGKMQWFDIIFLPYDAFMYYFERDNEIIWDEIFDVVSYDDIDPRILDAMNKKLEPAISTIEQCEFIEYASGLIGRNMCPDFIIHEIRNRMSFDVLYAHLLCVKLTCNTFFNQYINECNYIDEHKFMRACTVVDRRPSTIHLTPLHYDDQDGIDTAKLSSLLFDDVHFRFLYDKIMNANIFGDYAQQIVPKIQMLMEIFANA